MVNGDGYIMLGRGRGKAIFEHRVVWENANGPIPDGQEIHHRNEIRTDNRLENLECVTRLQHKRIHAGWLRDENGEFVSKKCKTCGEIKPLSDYYVNYRKEHFIACKECCKERRRRVHAEKKAAKPEKQLCL